MDGKTLEISAPGMAGATVTYGSWGATMLLTVTLYTIDPAADGNDTWYVVKVAFSEKPAQKTPNANPE